MEDVGKGPIAAASFVRRRMSPIQFSYMDGSDQVLEAIDAVLAEWDAISTRRGDDDGATTAGVRLMAAIQRYAGVNSTYVQDAARFSEHYVQARAASQAAVLRALRADIAAGYLATVEQLVHAGVFADFLEMAQELLDKGFMDPAAVMAGSVLEEHLRKLADAAGIATEKPDGQAVRADTLNASLYKADVYNKLEQKSVTAWLDLRNKAAHGETGEYTPGQVASLINDVRGLLIRHPA